jgi:hypothetical protein
LILDWWSEWYDASECFVNDTTNDLVWLKVQHRTCWSEYCEAEDTQLVNCQPGMFHTYILCVPMIPQQQAAGPA